MTLCNLCRQGFHKDCKSYRIKNQQQNQNGATVKKLEHLIEKMSDYNDIRATNREYVQVEYRPPGYAQAPYPPWTSTPPGMWYPQQPPAPVKAITDDEDDE